MNWKPEKREPCVIFVLHLHSLVFSPQPRFAQLKRQFMIFCNFRFALVRSTVYFCRDLFAERFSLFHSTFLEGDRAAQAVAFFKFSFFEKY